MRKCPFSAFFNSRQFQDQKTTQKETKLNCARGRIEVLLGRVWNVVSICCSPAPSQFIHTVFIFFSLPLILLVCCELRLPILPLSTYNNNSCVIVTLFKFNIALLAEAASVVTDEPSTGSFGQIFKSLAPLQLMPQYMFQHRYRSQLIGAPTVGPKSPSLAFELVQITWL